MEILKGFKKNSKTIRDNLSETVRRENNEQIIPKNLLGCLNVQVATKLIEEAKNWDIDIEKKWWFFTEFIPFSEFVTFCKENKISKTDLQDSISNKYLVGPHPLLMSLFYHDCYKSYLILREMSFEDQTLKDILIMPSKNRETILHGAAQSGNIEVASVLIHLKADLNVQIQWKVQHHCTWQHDMAIT